MAAAHTARALVRQPQAGDIELAWASIAGFADVLGVMAAGLWLANRHYRRRHINPTATN